MAQLSKPAIPQKMYKHFAAITFGLTALLALFASGSSQNEDSGTTAPRSTQPSSAPRPSATPRYGQAQFDTGGAVEVGNGYEVYEEYDESFGRDPSGRGNISALSNRDTPASGSENAGFTRTYLDSLTDAELDELLRQLRAGGVDDPAKRQQVIAVLESGARRRSGRATTME